MTAVNSILPPNENIPLRDFMEKRKDGSQPELSQRMAVVKPDFESCSTTRLHTPHPFNAIHMAIVPLRTDDMTEARACVLKSILRVRMTLWVRHNAVITSERPSIRSTSVSTGWPKKRAISGAAAKSRRYRMTESRRLK